MERNEDRLSRELVDRVLATPIEAVPFPHVVVTDLLPPAVYQAALAAIPSKDRLEKAHYPGTGYSLSRVGDRVDFGYAYSALSEDEGILGDLARALRRDTFARCLLDKFSAPTADGLCAIPKAKHVAFADGAMDFSTVFDLQVDLPGYAIAPHPDVPSKIVTFQLYLTKDQELADFGTYLCRHKPGSPTKRTRLTTWIAQAVERLPERSYQKLERSRLGLQLGLGNTGNWYPWDWFDIVKTVPALPNSFLAFAPNERSFHAVDLAIPDSARTRERCVIRGFIREGRSAENYIRYLSETAP